MAQAETDLVTLTTAVIHAAREAQLAFVANRATQHAVGKYAGWQAGTRGE